MLSATVLVFSLWITLYPVASAKVGKWSMYRLQTQCTIEHIPIEALPDEGFVGFPSVRDEIDCAHQCENEEDCASMSVMTEVEMVTCGLVDAEEHVCDDTMGMYRKVRSNYCENGGTWQDESECLCPDGWAGPFCNILNPDECESDPCVWGDCEDLINLFLCHCDSGFEGTTCEIDIDECESSPCDSAHGTCIDGHNGFTCDCQGGYQGTLCSEEINECESNPCMHGECNDHVNQFTCTCDPGYTSTLCDVDIDECASNPCYNGATCDDHVDYYTCSCAPGWQGLRCNADINECDSYPCVHGNCNNYENMYTCSCNPGYEGTNCDQNINECASNPCYNGGVCNDNVNYYTCSCSSGWQGTYCETDVDECTSYPCIHGNCNNYQNYYTCSCNAGYQGTNCDAEINECSSQPCVYGSCNDYVNYYTCSCNAGYQGTNCDSEINECVSNPCGGGGSCNNYVNYYTCSCYSGYSGSQCQYYNTPYTVSLSYGSYGILQIYYPSSGQWGTVCDDYFDMNNNGCTVVCRQLGYSSGIHVECGAGPEYLPILLDDVQCTGSEMDLDQCPHSPWGSENCGHHEDVGCNCNGVASC